MRSRATIRAPHASPSPSLSRASFARVGVGVRACVALACAMFHAAVSNYDTSARASGAHGAGAAAAGRHAVVERACAVVRDANAWDATHFVALATRGGYAFEHQHAFFPGLWMVIRAGARALARVLDGVLGVDVSFECASGVSAVVVSTLAFAVACEAARRLARQAFCGGHSDALALASAWLFALNPANVFYGIAYTESGFSCASFIGYLALADGWDVASGAAFGAAAAFRSNGVLHVIPVSVVIAARVIESLQKRNVRDACGYALRGVVACALVVAPYVAFSAYGDAKYCQNPLFAMENARRPWCVDSLSNAYGLLPKSMYGFLQRHYWGLGFLSSYSKRNAGNVALGAPAMILGIICVSRYFMRIASNKNVYHTPNAPLHERALVFAAYVQLAIGVFVASTYMHAQVATRFLSTFPAMYWGIADIGARDPRSRYAIAAYYVAYAILGALLVPNFYPWT